jgi:hypothetical protein
LLEETRHREERAEEHRWQPGEEHPAAGLIQHENRVSGREHDERCEGRFRERGPIHGASLPISADGDGEDDGGERHRVQRHRWQRHGAELPPGGKQVRFETHDRRQECGRGQRGFEPLESFVAAGRGGHSRASPRQEIKRRP